jgi:dTDP-4-dehydrorhamnose reductase
MRKTVLIVGASSFVGSNLVEALRDDFRLVGTHHKTPLRVPGLLSIPMDVHRKEYVNRLIAVLKPDFTVYLAGLSSLAACHANPKLADAMNSAGLINVCSSAERFGSKFVFISSSFVLGGEDLIYRESDTPFPLTVYGASLASSEFYVQKSCLNYVVLRTCPMYGRSFHPTRRNWFEVIEGQVARGQPLTVDDTVTHGYLDVQLLARVLKHALNENVTNRLFQVSSRDVMSRYEFARLYCKLFKRDENLVARGQWPFQLDENQARIGRPVAKPRFHMDVSNAEQFFNMRFPSVEESLTATRKRLAG